MRFIGKSVLSAALLGVGLLAGSIINSNAEGIVPTNQPGSINDPVVTKSYVDQQISSLVKAELAKQTGGGATTPDSSSSMVIVTLKPGEVLVASAGAEMIVRAGKATAYSTDGNGISDLTDGKDVANGQAVLSNHLMLLPKAGRGIATDTKAKGSVIVLVRGEHSVKTL